MAKTENMVVTSGSWVSLPANIAEVGLENTDKRLNVFVVVDDSDTFTANSDFDTAAKFKIKPDSHRNLSGLTATDLIWVRLHPEINPTLEAILLILH